MVAEGSIRLKYTYFRRKYYSRTEKKKTGKRVTIELLRDTHCARNVGGRLVSTAAGSFKNSLPYHLLLSPFAVWERTRFPMSSTRVHLRVRRRAFARLSDKPRLTYTSDMRATRDDIFHADGAYFLFHITIIPRCDTRRSIVFIFLHARIYIYTYGFLTFSYAPRWIKVYAPCVCV